MVTTLLFLFLVATAAAEHSPSCVNPASACQLYWWDYKVFAGRNLAINETILSPNDVVVKFKQQSRRAFPRWNRYLHLYQVENKPYEFIYAPGAEWPLECNDRLYNVKLSMNETSAILRTDRIVGAADPIFVECYNDDLSEGSTFDDLPEVDLETLEKEGVCLDQVKIDKENGVVAKRPILKGGTVAFGRALHMHRAEFYNETSKKNEELLQYTFGHPKTDLLILPNTPVVSSIRHSKTPNAKLEWDSDEAAEELFNDVTEFLFGEEEEFFWIKVVALRDIGVDEVITMDFGDVYDMKSERAVPEGFFPNEWLERETRQLASEMLNFKLTKLEPGQVQQATLENDKPLGTYLHRVGLPPHLADTMEDWARDLGVLDFVKRYTTDKVLEIGAEERVRFNNGTWWARRFPSSWHSNMHYLSVDDDESTEQFFHVLARGGFDQVLAGIGEHLNLTTLTAFYPTYIVVNHCVKAYMHSDSDHPNVFNLIFPVVQVNDDGPELILGEDDFSEKEFGKKHVPYRYERDHGIMVGMDGMHGTAPTDYRGHGHRVVVSVYMGDFSSNEDDFVTNFINDWEDPPYPNYHPGELNHALTKRVHWKKDDPSISIGGPMPRAFSNRHNDPFFIGATMEE